MIRLPKAQGTWMLGCLLFGMVGAIAQAQDLFVGNHPVGNVLRFDGISGAYEEVFASGGGLDTPTSATFGPNGNLFVVSSITEEVLEYDGGTGDFVRSFA